MGHRVECAQGSGDGVEVLFPGETLQAKQGTVTTEVRVRVTELKYVLLEPVYQIIRPLG